MLPSLLSTLLPSAAHLAVSLAPLAVDPAPKAGPADDEYVPKVDEKARIVPFDEGDFRPVPKPLQTWNEFDSVATYVQNKGPVDTQRPLLELGRELYREGPFQEGANLLGEANLSSPHLLVYGDWRVAGGFNSIDLLDGGGAPGKDGNAENFSQIATRLNLDIDLKLTGTERIHAFMQPFEKNGNISRLQFGDLEDDETQLDGNLDTLFFEGDLGAIFTGDEHTNSTFDMPFAVGLMPLLFQNGIWVEDAFTGVAVTLPAKNSTAFNISNYDITFFAGFDKVTTQADVTNSDSDASIFGATAFLEMFEGYIETGYAYTAVDDDDSTPGVDESEGSYHNLTAAFTRRYGALISNSIRVILNFGGGDVFDFDGDGSLDAPADGVLLLVENSLITKKPYTVVPYLNLFAGSGRPASLARAAGAGGVLKNTGINFEADLLTGFQSLNALGHDAVGAALGVEFLFNLDQQLVLEVAGQSSTGDNALFQDTQYAVGARWQKPLDHRFIVRADAVAGVLDDDDEFFGARLEFRWKF